MSVLKNLSYFFLPLPLAGASLAEEKNKYIVVGHKECSSSITYAPAVMDKIRQTKWFFAHASVGSNMVDGLADLNSQDAQRYPLQFLATDREPPASTIGGKVYEHNRGNPGWKAKFDRFETCLDNGWRSPTAQVVMNKLCYIDQGASLKYYLHSMTNLEARFPDTVIVYTTIPLTTSADGDNFLRNAFNDRLREWVRQNGRVLFDIADIEAHDPEGKPATFQYRNKTCQKLREQYTNDGGHLVGVGRQAVARGFYAVSAALIESGRIRGL